MTTRKTHSAIFKAQVVQQVLREDKTLAQIAAEHGIHPNQISQWEAATLDNIFTERLWRSVSPIKPNVFARFLGEGGEFCLH